MLRSIFARLRLFGARILCVDAFYGLLVMVVLVVIASPVFAQEKILEKTQEKTQEKAAALAVNQQTNPPTYTAASSNNFPPINMLDGNGVLVGFGRELATAVIRAGGGTVKQIHSAKWSEVLAWLDSGKADFIHDTGFAEERLKYLDYSAPILAMSEVVFMRESDNRSVEGHEDLKKINIACVRKHITHLYITSVLGMNCQVYETPIAGLMSVLSGETDAFPFPEQIGRYLMQRLDLSHRFKISGQPLRSDLVWHMTVKKGNAKMLSVLNKGIAEVRKSGEYDNIYLKWFHNDRLSFLSQREGLILILGGLSMVILVIGLILAYMGYRRLRLTRNQLRANIDIYKDTQKALRESETRFREIIDATSYWCWEMDKEYRFTHVSEKFEETTGISVNEYFGKTRWDMSRVDEAEDFLQDHRKILEDHKPFQDFEYTVVSRDGIRRWVQVSGVPFFDEEGNFEGYRGAAKDVTERVITQEKINNAQSMLRLVLESSGDDFALFDKDDCLMMSNQKFLVSLFPNKTMDVVGKPYEEIIRLALSDDVFLGNVSDNEKLIQAQLEDFKAGTSDVFHTSGGQWVRVRNIKVPNGMTVCVRTDISELKIREAELQASQIRLMRAHRIASIGDWEWTLDEYGVPGQISWSEELYEIFGQDPEVYDCTYQNFLSHVHPEDISRVQSTYQEVSFDRQSYDEEYRIINAKTEEVRWIHVLAEIQDSNGQKICIAGTIQDITGRKREEAQLRQAQKMEAIGQLTEGIAHDFNNLLTIIIGNLRLVSEDILGLDDTVKDAFADVVSAAEEGADLTRRLLAFGRERPEKLVTVNFATDISPFVDLLRRVLTNDIELVLKLEEPLPGIYVDLSQFESSLLNLALNGRNAMPDGGCLTIEARVVSADQVRVHSFEAPVADEYIAVTVSDTGRGLTSEEIERVCEPFYSKNIAGADIKSKEHQGSGLGLSLVFRFVRQSSGHMFISSEPGVGTSVCLYLPITPLDTANALVDDDVDVLPTGWETILVVEDEERILSLTKSALEALGYNIVAAINADSAIEILEANEEIDCLFSDIIMPGKLSGYQLADWVRAHKNKIKILLTTGYEGHMTQPDSERTQVYPMLRKPYTRQQLAVTIRAVIDDAQDPVNNIPSD